MQLFDLFLSNWPDPKETGFGWGIGPTFVFPTGRDPKAGEHAWQVGPAAAAVYRGVPHLMVGFLFQNPISFAYTNSSATPQSEMEFQPLISYTLGRGWYVKSADSTWTVNWRHGSSTTIPISLGFGRVWKFEGPELNTWVSGEWTAYRQYTKITPMYTVTVRCNVPVPTFRAVRASNLWIRIVAQVKIRTSRTEEEVACESLGPFGNLRLRDSAQFRVSEIWDE